MSRRALFKILLQAAERRRALADSGTNAYRLLNAEAEGVPGVTIDWFDGVAVASLYDAPGMPSGQQIASALEQSLRPRAVYLKRRPRNAARVDDAEKRALAPEAPLAGHPVGEHIVAENYLRFLIRPAQGLAVGLYLDMRDSREWVRRQSRSKRVLNCFAYTCGFAVAALAGGAERVVNVDLSRRSLNWGENNARLNGLPVSRSDCISGDVFDWLRRFRKNGQLFDTVILDPPSFARSKKDSFSAASDWTPLVERACGVLRPSGTLLACCNLSSLSWARFERMVTRGLENVSRRGRLTCRLGPSGIDFPVPPGTAAPLKVLAHEVR